MGRRIIDIPSFTPSAYADTTSYGNSSYAFYILGGSASQLVRIHEVSILGQAASSSSPTFMILARDSTIAALSTSYYTASSNDTFMDATASALSSPTITGNGGSSNPQRSATGKLLNLSLNAFGGINFWRANKWDECPTIYSNNTTSGEVSLSAFTGGTVGLIGVHAIYEAA
jgi:hypothetical protein